MLNFSLKVCYKLTPDLVKQVHKKYKYTDTLNQRHNITSQEMSISHKLECIWTGFH